MEERIINEFEQLSLNEVYEIALRINSNKFYLQIEKPAVGAMPSGIFNDFLSD